MPSENFYTTYDCGDRSTLVVTHPSKVGDFLYINHIQSNVLSGQNFSFECKGITTVGCSDGDYSAVLIPLTNEFFSENFLLGFAGIVCGLLIVRSFFKR